MHVDALARTLHRRGFLATLAALPLIVTGRGTARANHEPIPQPGAVPGAIPALLSRYDLGALNTKIRYRPRQWAVGAVVPDLAWGNWNVTNAGAYAGWDYLPLPNYSSSRITTVYPFASYTMNRPAKVALVWRAGNPVADWVAADGWSLAGSVTANNPSRGWTFTYPTYTKSFPAGEFVVGANYDPGDSTAAGTRNLPWLLFAEADGTPSAPPVLPPGQTEAPTPNATCPDWVHDLYQTIGPDGSLYATWHPAIDPLYWCYFRHEHGSDPVHAFPQGDWTPYYGYVAGKAGMTENHWGHKSAAFRNGDGYWLYVTQHVGTWGVARANTCLQRFHLVDIIVRNSARTETLAHLQVMADYGRSMVSSGTNPQPYTPSACPTGNADTGLTTSVPTRRIPLSTTGQVSYEPWQFDQFRYASMGLSGALTINTQQPIDICSSLVCDTPLRNPTFAGVSRLVQPTANLRITDPGISPDGHFCTNGMGAVQDCALPDSVAQYIQPGLDLGITGTGNLSQTHFETRWWGDPHVITAGGALDPDPEGSIVETHGPN